MTKLENKVNLTIDINPGYKLVNLSGECGWLLTLYIKHLLNIRI